MEATPSYSATIVDLLDRVLDKGLLISADIIISVAGVPLVAINLRAAVAGVETMLAYGMMKDLVQTTGDLGEGDGRLSEAEPICA